MKKILAAVTAYLRDWKNLLVHTLVGLGILALAAFLPVPWYHRVAILLGVVALNTGRMILVKVLRKMAAERVKIE